MAGRWTKPARNRLRREGAPMTARTDHFTRRGSDAGPPAPPDPLAEQLRSLGLYVMAERYGELAEEARKAKSPYPQYLGALVSAQLAARMDRSFKERLTRARFPALKTLEAFDFGFQPTLDETQVRTLAELTFLQH